MNNEIINRKTSNEFEMLKKIKSQRQGEGDAWESIRYSTIYLVESKPAQLPFVAIGGALVE